jgi:hypothetical protein
MRTARNVSMREEDWRAVDALAEQAGLTRSAMLAVLVRLGIERWRGREGER